VHRAGDGISALGASLATNLPQLAEQLGIYEPPRRRRGGAATAAAGIALATAVAILLSDEQARRRLRTALGR
jgi:ferric-dicitrate binding protein FerR (iron transport regulator)